jgi:hypothetical protein
MKKILFTTLLFIGSIHAFSQLNGSGNIINKTYDYSGFDKVYFNDLHGEITIEIGKPFSISINIDDNLEGLLNLSENKTEHELIISLKGNERNKMYIENTNIKIKITMPEASVIKNNGNSSLNINNILGRYFRLENNGNGGSKLSGSVDKLDIVKHGNGGVIANKLFAKTSEITSAGNGDILVNVAGDVTVQLSGNGDVKNSGRGRFIVKGKMNGNGKLISE